MPYSYHPSVPHLRTGLTLQQPSGSWSQTSDHIGQLRTVVGTGGQSTENLQYGYDTAWNLSKRTNAGVIHTPSPWT